MTGILPIKKYGTLSALTDFREFSMLEPVLLAEYVGFTEKEVRDLCQTNYMDFDGLKTAFQMLWYLSCRVVHYDAYISLSNDKSHIFL